MKLRNVINPSKLLAHRQLVLLGLRRAAISAGEALIGSRVDGLIRRLPFDMNSKRLLSLKQRHDGQRCFIIGNGPSLRMSDLDRLAQEVTFASNKIYLAFSETDWRPTYYTVLDYLVAQQHSVVINDLPLTKIFASSVMPCFELASDITWVYSMPMPMDGDKPLCRFSRDLLKGMFGGWTVLYSQLQIAYYMGIREVYLVGVDFYFDIPQVTGEMSMHGEVLLHEDGTNHFHPDYREPGEKWTMPRLDLQQEAFRCARRAFEDGGGAILNASRKTALDVFPLVDFDSIIN